MEMTYDNGPDGPQEGPRRFVKPAIGVLVVLVVGGLIWHFASDTAGVKRAEAPRITTVIPVPPPPPPPPKVKPPPEKVEDTVKTPLDKPTPVPKPSEAPKPSDNQPKQMTMNAPAQAGNDGFNIAAGDGSGMAGSGGGIGRFGNASYGQYMVYTLQQAIERDKQVQDAGGARFAGSLNLWMEPNGRITKVTIAQSTGDTKIDDAVVNAVMSLGKVDEPPPPATTYPVIVKLQGRQPG
jgi:protein TonB